MKTKIIYIALLIFVVYLSFYHLFSNEGKNKTVKKEHYENGQLKTITPYVNGKIEGIKKMYYENGKLFAEISYKDGYQDGTKKEYFDNGKLFYLCNYKGGKRNGVQTEYYEDGEIKDITNYINGKEDGISKSYFDWGQLSSVGFYKNGKLEGSRKSFRPYGLRHIAFYKNGVLFGDEIEYGRFGNIIKKIIHDGKGNKKIIIDRPLLAVEKLMISEKKTAIVNRKYLIYTEDNNTLVIIDQDNLSLAKKHFDFEIVDFETHYKHKFINLETFTKKDASVKFIDYIYDIETNDLYSVFSPDRGYREEERWSDDGRFTFFNNKSSITIIETIYLEDYLKSKEVPNIVEITINQEGYIWQVNWTGNYLLYSASPICWRECWGIYDLKKRQNYFISCCGYSWESKFNLPLCEEFISSKSKIRVLESLIEKGELIEISNDFQKEVARITGYKVWGD